MILLIILVVLMFGLLVFVHELGHFVAARKRGVEVDEFGFGFPPRLIGVKRGRTIYSINLLPLGGFVRLAGEDQDDTRPGTFNAASFKTKTLILAAGVGMNALLAYLILLWLCLTGLPPVLEHQFSIGSPRYAQPKHLIVVDVAKGSPAAGSGISIGDKILSADGQALTTENELINFTKAHAGQPASFVVDGHDGQTRTLSVRLSPPDSKSGFLGVTPLASYQLRYNLWQAPVVAAGLLGQLVWGTLAAFGGLLAGLIVHHQVSEQVTGPVGIVVLLSSLTKIGAAYVWLLVASISISLAVINFLPFPALDGGRWAIIAWGRVTGKRLTPAREGLIHTIGFAVLIAFMVFVTFTDVRRLF